MLIHGAADNDLHPPRFGGTQRTFGLYRGLARRHDVRVLCMVENRSRAPREERVAGVALSRRAAWYTAAAWRLERARAAPLWLAALGHRVAAGRLAAALPGEPDVRSVDFNLAGLLARPGRALRVYLSQNVEYDFFLASAPRLAARGFWAERVRAFEADAVARADLVVAVSDEDAARFRALYGAREEALAVVPNGWDETAVRPATPAARAAARAALGLARDDYVLLFVGSDFAHNREALRWTVDVLMPAVGPSVRLVVAGAVTRALGGRREPWLVAVGPVDDLAPLLAAADAGLNPVESGGGSNVKLPTYLGAGLAALTTPFGLRGYAPLAPHAVVAERAAFADAVRARPRGWAAAGDSAPPPAVAAFAWGALGERLGACFEARLAARRAGGAP